MHLEQQIVNSTRSFIENDRAKELWSFPNQQKRKIAKVKGRFDASRITKSKSITLPITVNLIFRILYLEMQITKIERLVDLTTNVHVPQFGPSIYQEPITQRLVNMQMWILKIHSFLLMTSPGLHTSYLIFINWNEKLIS